VLADQQSFTVLKGKSQLNQWFDELARTLQ